MLFEYVVLQVDDGSSADFDQLRLGERVGALCVRVGTEVALDVLERRRST